MAWIERCNGQSAFGNACTTGASPTGNALVSAGVPQVSRRLLWRLRVLPQVPREMLWRLQHRCKSHEKLFGVCNTVASLTKNFLAFATPLQVPRKTFWRLQHCCKSHEKLSGVCNTVASLTKNFLAFATPLQVSRKTFWRLQHCCKHFQKRFGHGVAPVETLGGLYSYY